MISLNINGFYMQKIFLKSLKSLFQIDPIKSKVTPISRPQLYVLLKQKVTGREKINRSIWRHDQLTVKEVTSYMGLIWFERLLYTNCFHLKSLFRSISIKSGLSMLERVFIVSFNCFLISMSIMSSAYFLLNFWLTRKLYI